MWRSVCRGCGTSLKHSTSHQFLWRKDGSCTNGTFCEHCLVHVESSCFPYVVDIRIQIEIEAKRPCATWLANSIFIPDQIAKLIVAYYSNEVAKYEYICLSPSSTKQLLHDLHEAKTVQLVDCLWVSSKKSIIVNGNLRSRYLNIKMSCSHFWVAFHELCRALFWHVDAWFEMPMQNNETEQFI